MIHNSILQTVLDFLHLMATIAWIGGMVFNFLVVMPTVNKVLDPAMAGKFMGALFKRVRIVVYSSLIILFVTGIPMKIASQYYVGIINFDNNWEIVGFIKHIFVALLALMAIYSFEVLSPKVAKLAVKGPSPELMDLRNKQMKLGGVSFLFGIIVIFLSARKRFFPARRARPFDAQQWGTAAGWARIPPISAFCFAVFLAWIVQIYYNGGNVS